MRVDPAFLAREIGGVDRDAGKMLRHLLLRLCDDSEEAEEIAAAPPARQVEYILDDCGFGFDFLREFFGLPI